MKNDGSITAEYKGNVKTERSHADKMRSLGYETPAPIPKRFKTAWAQLVENFPCPPEVQHKMWACRIQRMFNEDCGFPADWKCECQKCVRATSDEITGFYESVSEMCECKFPYHYPLDDDPMATNAVDTVCLQRVTAGVLKDVPRTYLTGEEDWEGGEGIIRFAHLYADEESARADDMSTPFTTVVGVFNGRVLRPRPRLMWVRAKHIEPTHLSFK